jgi:hypothetical protein
MKNWKRRKKEKEDFRRTENLSKISNHKALGNYFLFLK